MRTTTDRPIRMGMKPPHPGAFIRTEILQPLDLSVTDGAKALGVSRVALSSLLNAQADLSGDMAVRIEKAFGVPMETLMRMQASYDMARLGAGGGTMTDSAFRQYRKSQIAEMRPYVEGEPMAGISVSAEDTAAGSPRLGDFIARNPANHADQWLVSAAFVAANYVPASDFPDPPEMKRSYPPRAPRVV